MTAGPAVAPRAGVVAAGGLRRCTYRRLELLVPARRGLDQAVYDVACLYPDRAAPRSLGDLAAARPTCEACVASGIFRPDEA